MHPDIGIVCTDIQSIYENRWHKHPHSPILRHEWCPQGTAPRPCYIEPCPDLRYVYVPESPPMSRLPRELRRFVKIPPIDTSGIRRYPCCQHWQFCAGHNFGLKSTHRFRLDSTHRFWLELTHCFQLVQTHSFWLDLTQFPPDSIWLTFNKFILNLSHTIWFL